MEELNERLAAENTTPEGHHHGSETIPLTTTAPPDADIGQVRAGMLVREAEGKEGYAAEGSLAKDMERERGREEKVGS